MAMGTVRAAGITKAGAPDGGDGMDQLLTPLKNFAIIPTVADGRGRRLFADSPSLRAIERGEA